MYKTLKENDEYDCVAAFQEKRSSGLFRNQLSRRFYKMLAKASGMEVLVDASDFRVFKRIVADAILSMSEAYRFSKGLFAWIGFKTLPYPYQPNQRTAGETKWSFGALVSYALNGLLSFSVVPLRVATLLGFLAGFSAFLYLVVIIVQALVFGTGVPGFATIVALILLLGGILLFFLGVLGEYVGRIYIQGKRRPIFVVREDINLGLCDVDLQTSKQLKIETAWDSGQLQ